MNLIRSVSVSLQQITCFLDARLFTGTMSKRFLSSKGVQVYSSTQWWQRIAQLMGTEAQKHTPPSHSIYLCKSWKASCMISAIRNFSCIIFMLLEMLLNSNIAYQLLHVHKLLLQMSWAVSIGQSGPQLLWQLMLKTENDGQKCFLCFGRLITCYTASMWRHFVPKKTFYRQLAMGLSMNCVCIGSAGSVGKWGKPPSLRSLGSLQLDSSLVVFLVLAPKDITNCRLYDTSWSLTVMWCTPQDLAPFPGCSRNGLATLASSSCTWV